MIHHFPVEHQAPMAKIETIYVVCDSFGCPRFSFDLSPSGFTNKMAGSPAIYGKVVSIIDPITVLMANILTQSEIDGLGWPSALATTLALLGKPRG
jgi:hypothetical protein